MNKLEERLKELERAIENYEELDSDIDNPEYVARGNGFCDSKYGTDFIESQLKKLKAEKTALEKQLK